MNTNISQLQPHPPLQIQRVSKEGQEKEGNFLALRLLNKRARVRLSPDPLKLDALPSRGNLFAVSNSKACFAAIICNAASEYSLILSSLSELRTAFTSTSSEGEPSFTLRRTIPLLGPATAIAFASGDSKIIVAFAQGSIAVYDTQAISNHVSGVLPPLHIFTSPTGTAAHELVANPGDLPDLVAVLFETGGPGTEVVQLLDVQKLQVTGGWTSGGSPQSTPTSICWSPKGKQLAVGLQSGDIVTFNPSDTSKPKSFLSAPTSAQSQSVISTTWLSNPDFHCIYAPAGPLTPESEQTHIVLSLESKANTLTDVKLNTPYYPVPGLRPPGAFTAVLKHWEPAKFLLFIGDSTSSDIGVIGCTTEPSGEEVWVNLSLEETSTPSLPLDKDMNDTILLGLSFDLTGTEDYTHTTVSGELATMPPPPVLYAYVSDGTILGWNVINVSTKPYPGLVSAPSAVDSSTVSMETSVDHEDKLPVTVPVGLSVEQQSAAKPTFAQASTFGGTSQGPSFGQSAFGQTSAFSQPTPAFGSTSFGQPSSSSSAPFGTTAPSSGGFGAFASAGTSKFGQAGFGVNTLAPPAVSQGTSLASPMAISMSNSEEPMSADVETDAGLGGLSLGGTSGVSETDKPKSSFGGGGLFGSFASTPSDSSKPPSTFGSTGFGSGGSAGLLKPATGFGAYANQGPSAFGAFSSSPAPSGEPKVSAFGNASASAGTTQASPAFGQSGFAAKPAFGKSSFGQSSFGQPAFGQSAFSTAPAKPELSTTGSGASGGGFAAFAKAGPTGFGSFVKPAEPEKTPSQEAQTIKTESPEADMSASEPVANNSGAASSSAAVTTQPSPATPDKTSSVFGGTNTTTSSQTIPSTTPTTSPFKSSTPGPATGAFAGLTAHPTGFAKLDSGFGAFGNVLPNASSPFLNPPKVSSTGAFGVPVSAFASAPSSTTPEKTAQPTFGAPSAFGAAASSGSPSSKPTFGAPSPLGGSAFGKSAFPATPAPIKPASITSGGFSAFAGTGGFSALSGSGKSFSDLLKADTDAAGKGKAKESVEETKTVSSAADKKPVSVFATLSRVTSSSDTNEAEKEPESSKSEAREHDDEEQGDEEDDREGAEDEDDTVSFLSESFSDEEEPAEEVTKDEAEDESEQSSTPAAVKEKDIAPEESPTLTAPSIQLLPSSPPVTSGPLEKEKLSSVSTESSTTPPGSPLKDGPPVVAPAPVTAAPATSPFGGVGLGRPSTRPIRSSPLASAPISGDEGEEEEEDDEDDDGELEEVTIRPETTSPEATPETKKDQPTTPTALPSLSTNDDSAGGLPAKARPKTPPLLSTITTPVPKMAPFTLAAAKSPTTPESGPSGSAAKSGSIFSTPVTSSGFFGKPTTPPTPSPFGAPSTGVFGQKPTISPPALGGGGTPPPNVLSTPMPPLPPGGLFGPRPSNATPKPVGESQPQQTTSILGAGFLGSKFPPAPSPVPVAGGSLFGQTPQRPATQASPPTSKPMDPLAQMEEGMQKECLILYMTLTRELEAMKKLTEQSQKRRADYYQTDKTSRTLTDLSDPTKFKVGDAAEFGRIMLTLEKDVAELKELRAAHLKSIADLESGMLRATMRKEEIVRFSKASTDAEFAKMLKARTLGPDHLETQMQLRRGIRVLSDRIQKLEDHISASKKRLSQLKSGKPGIRPPSLDTINRTYRNIDLAISQQADDIARLTSRVAKLDLQSTRSPARSNVRDGRLPADAMSSPTGRPIDVTPNVAVRTAAALNAERAAQKLKGALLNVRKTPLMNTQALRAPAPPSAFYTPVKEEQTTPAAGLFNSGPSLWQPPSSPLPDLPQTPKWTLPPFQLPDSPASPTPAHGTSLRQRGSASGKSLHQKPIQLKKSAGSPPVASPPPNFSWGPLPGVSPMTTLSSDVRKKDGSSSSTPLGASLSDSWVADGFDKK